MGFQILSESYGRRLPKITAEADSTDDLTELGTDYAEGSTCNVGGTEYTLDKVGGWVIPGSGGGSDLPDVTAADNGDVLTVVNGAWDKAEPSGGGGVLEVHADVSTGILDKTWQEIDNVKPLAYLVNEGVYFPLASFGSEGGVYYVVFHDYQNATGLSFETDAADGYPHINAE